jgi:hypothetical protein
MASTLGRAAEGNPDAMNIIYGLLIWFYDRLIRRESHTKPLLLFIKAALLVNKVLSVDILISKSFRLRITKCQRNHDDETTHIKYLILLLLNAVFRDVLNACKYH